MNDADGPKPRRSRPKAPTTCPEGKILNPASGRCVLIDGAIGRRILAAARKLDPDPAPKPAPKPRPKTTPKPGPKPNDRDVEGPSRRSSPGGGRSTPRVHVEVAGSPKTFRVGIRQCSKVLTYIQKGGICWFTALMASLFMSETMRMVIAQKLPDIKDTWKWPIVKDIANIIEAYNVRNSATVESFERLRPDKFLVSLGERNSKRFDAEAHQGGFSEPYTVKFLNFLGIDHYAVYRPNALLTTCYKSILNYKLPSDILKAEKKVMDHDLEEYDTTNPRNPQVLLVSTRSRFVRYLSQFWKGSYEPVMGVRTNRHAKKITFNGIEYTLDSLLISSVDVKECTRHHAIAGVTCNGKPYVYNGWFARSKDPAMRGTFRKPTPCSLMDVDWTKKHDWPLEIDSFKCTLVPVKQTITKDDLLFDLIDATTALYVRSDVARKAVTWGGTFDRPVESAVLDRYDSAVAARDRRLLRNAARAPLPKTKTTRLVDAARAPLPKTKTSRLENAGRVSLPARAGAENKCAVM